MTIVCLEENEEIWKSFEKNGLARHGASMMALLIYSNDIHAYGFHLTSMFILSKLVIYFRSSVEFTLNLYIKFVSPKND